MEMDAQESYTKYLFTVTDNKVVLGTGEPVQEQTKWIPVASQMSAVINTEAKTQEVITMADETKTDVTPQVAAPEMITKAEADAQFTELRNTNKQLLNKLKEAEVDKTLAIFKQAGKMTPALEPMAKVILMSGSEVVTFGDTQTDVAAVFTKFVETLPELVKFAEQGDTSGTLPSTEYTADQHVWAKRFGVELGG
jgi:hypothetical protein